MREQRTFYIRQPTATSSYGRGFPKHRPSKSLLLERVHTKVIRAHLLRCIHVLTGVIDLPLDRPSVRAG